MRSASPRTRPAVLVAAIAVLAGATACAPAADPLPAGADPTQGDNPLHGAAYTLVERHCGRCHRPDGEDAFPEPLAIFDLSRPDWQAPLTDAQLRQFPGRIAEAHLFRPGLPEASPEDAEAVEDWVAVELVRRHAPTQ